MKATAALLAGLAVAAAGPLAGAANIDTDGFVHDGRTTYCQAASTEQGPLQFLSLSPSSASKCPVTLELNAQLRSVSMADRTLDLTWSASLMPSASLFTGVLNKTSESVRVVLRACRVGSNCATDGDVVVPTGISQDSVGGLNGAGAKSLPGCSITLPSTNAYVIVGKVTVPGDPSPTDFVVFKHVAVEAESRPGTVQPVDGSKAGGPLPQPLAGVAGSPSNPPASPAAGTPPASAPNATPPPFNFEPLRGDQPSAPKPPSSQGGGSSGSQPTANSTPKSNDATPVSNANANSNPSANLNATPISGALSTSDNQREGVETSSGDNTPRSEGDSTPTTSGPSPEGAPVDPKGGGDNSVGSVTSNGSDGDSTTMFVSIAAGLVVVVAGVFVVAMRIRKARREDSVSNAVLSDSLYVAPHYVDPQQPRDGSSMTDTTGATETAMNAPSASAATEQRHQPPPQMGTLRPVNPRFARASSAQSTASTNTTENMEFTLNSKNETIFIADFT